MPLTIQARSRVGAAVSLGLILTGMNGCSGVPGQQPDATGSVGQGIEATFVALAGQGNSNTFTVIDSGFGYAALLAPEGSCGLTFISKHYGITAGHCVGGMAYGGGKPVYEAVTNTALTWSAVTNAGTVTGNWPGWTTGSPLTAAQGYNVTASVGILKYRCGTGGEDPSPTPNCTDPATMADSGMDIALIYDPWRTATSYVTVNTGDPSTVGTSIWFMWMHEVLGLPISGDPNTNPQWRYYGYYNRADEGNPTTYHDPYNFHYTNESSAQFLPLLSYAWPNGTNYTLTERFGAPTNGTWVDAPICHGTSGSGLYMSGTSTLIGPALQGNGADVTLCSMGNVAPGGTNTMFGNANITRVLETWVIGQGDR